MTKRILFIFGTLLSFLVLSCSNVVSGDYGSSSFSFSLEKEVVDRMAATLKANESITDNTELKIDCQLLGNGSVKRDESQNVLLKDLSKATFNLKNISYGNDYSISLKISYKDILLYKAQSDKFSVDDNNSEVNITLELEENLSKITFISDGKSVSGMPKSYFIDSDIKLPSLTKDKNIFDGWYLSEEYKPEERIESLGKKCFLGDVTLYAKWTDWNTVNAVTFSRTGEVDYNDTVTLSCTTEGAEIHYSINDGAEQILSSPYEIAITEATTIKAYATKSGMNDSSKTTATYTIKTYTVTFDNGGHGTAPAKLEGLKKGDNIPADKLTSLTTEGYTFNGWYVDNKKLDSNYKINGNTTLTANWSINHYTISYETGVTETIAQKTVEYNYSLTNKDLPDTLQKTGSTFDGWYVDNKKVDTNYKVTKDITLTANWTEWAKVDTVTFIVSPNSAGNSVDYDDKLTLSCATGGATIYYTTDGTEPSESSIKYTAPFAIQADNDITIKAIAVKDGMKKSQPAENTYTIKKYEATFMDGSVHKRIPNLHKNQTFTAEQLEITKEGYTFNGWYVGEQKVDTSYKIPGAIILEAKWTPWDVVSDVTFSVTGGEVDYQDKVTLSCATEGAEIHYSINDGVDQILSSPYEITITEATKINAYATKSGMKNGRETTSSYTIKTYTVTFNNGGHGTAPTVRNLKKGDSITKPDDLTENGYTFEGWYKDSNFTEPAFDFINTKVQTSSINLYAKWNLVTYKITYDLGSTGADNSNTTNTYTIESSDIKLTPPAKNGYTGKWIVGNVEKENIPRGSTGDITLTAKMTPITYNITYENCSNLENSNRTTYTIEDTVTLNNISKPNYIFNGWYTDNNFSNKVTELKGSTGNKTFYAKWTQVVVNINTKAGAIDFGDIIEITAQPAGSEIRYTIDGSEPTSSSTLYSENNLKVNDTLIASGNSFTIKAIAINNGVSSAVSVCNYNMKTYTVTFNNGGHGTAPTTITGKKKGEVIQKPDDLSLEGFTFDGWFNNDKKVTGEIIITSNITLTAKWTEWATIDTVTFSVSPESVGNSVDYDDMLTLSCATGGATIYYTKDGTEPSERSTKYTVPFAIQAEDNITIKAIAVKDGMKKSQLAEKKYTIKKYEVIFKNDVNGSEIKRLSLHKNQTFTAEQLEITKEGYTFNGWYVDNQKVDTSYKIPGDITLVAKWTEWATVNTVTFTPSGEVDYGDTATLSCGTSGATIHYTVGGGAEQTAVNSATITITDNVTVTAYATKTGMNRSTETSADYTIKTYTVTFHNNEHGTLPQNANKTGLKKGESINITSPGDLTAEGYNFGGWYDTSDCNGSPFNFGMTTIQAASINIYAKWTPITYTVQFNANGGKGDVPVNITDQNYDTEFTLPSYTLTKSGFDSKGKWNTKADGSGTPYDAGSSTPVKNLTTADNTTVTLYAQWTDVAPGAVTGLTATTSSGKIILNWTNPADEDIDKVVITCDDTSVVVDPVSVVGKAGKSSSCKVLCENGKVYKFGLKVADKADFDALESDVQTLSQRLYVLTESPAVLKDYIPVNKLAEEKDIGVTKPTGSNGNWEYIEFGDWPQTIKAAGVTLSQETVDKNNWACYYGNDGYYYVKVNATPYYKAGYHNDSTQPNTIYKFTDDTTVENGREYYFKLEPIQWRVLTVDYKVPDGTSSGNKLLLAEKALAAHRYHQSSNKYDTSEIREYLNGTGTFNNKGFLQKAFTPTAITHIQETVVDNSAKSTFQVGKEPSTEPNSNACVNTTDKIFLLSVKESTTIDYGFCKWGDTPDSGIQRMATDYAKATGIIEDKNKGSYWWLRSPRADSKDRTNQVTSDGYSFLCGQATNLTEWGVVPALTIPSN